MSEALLVPASGRSWIFADLVGTAAMTSADARLEVDRPFPVVFHRSLLFPT